MRLQVLGEAGGESRFYKDGVQVTREEYYAALASLPSKLDDLFSTGEAPGGMATTLWPMKSLSMGCNPSQVKAMTARNKRHGVNVGYTAAGDAVIPNPAERAKLAKLEGLVDKS